MLQTGYTIQDYPIYSSIFFEGVEPVIQAFWLSDLTALVDGDVSVLDFAEIVDRCGI
jgi:hypothetical protein